MAVGEYKLKKILREEGCSYKIENFSTINKTFSNKYWEETTYIIIDELKKIGIIIYECYFVGSGINNKILDDIEDVDSVIILNGHYSDETLLFIRNVIDNLLVSVDYFKKYHFRLFDKVDFYNFANYDGYRLFEFQCNNISLLGTDILNKLKPVFNSDNFNISYLIQLVYDCLMDKNIFLFKIESKKAADRLRRNLEINSINGIEIFKTNSIINEFFELRNISNQSIFNWQNFLKKYYSRIKHEYINKSYKYQRNLEEYLCH